MKILYDNQDAIYSDMAVPEDLSKAVHLDAGGGEDIGGWRQRRIFRKISGLIKPEATWLTVGDGRFGSDAAFLRSFGARVHATDLSTKLLKIAAERGLIESFSRENAEDLTFSDDSFDYVFIKEAMHHFPRPWLALHEAFRVCRAGVVLFEPNGQEPTLLSRILRILRRRSPDAYYRFEKVGNFLYSVNETEIEKFLLGMHFRILAVTFYNDYYLREAEYVPLMSVNSRDRRLRRAVFREISRRNLFSRLGIFPYAKIGVVLFKREPSRDLLKTLSSNGWNVKYLPKNPFI